MNLAVLGLLSLHFTALGLIAFGGIGALTPEIHRLVVEEQHWMTAREFTDLFAIAQAAPGPNVMIVTLIGWKAAGILGALAATLAISLPGAWLTLGIVRLWQRFRDTPWRARIQAGLAPVTVGLVFSTALLLARLADEHLMAGIVTLIAMIVAWRTNLHPFWLLAAGALLGMAGVV